MKQSHVKSIAMKQPHVKSRFVQFGHFGRYGRFCDFDHYDQFCHCGHCNQFGPEVGPNWAIWGEFRVFGLVLTITKKMLVWGIEPVRKKKACEIRIGPRCTLSQNGYGTY